MNFNEQQIRVNLHPFVGVAANYKLRRTRIGWAVGYACLPGKYIGTYSPFAIKPLLKRGLLEGNSSGEKAGLRSWYTALAGTPELWTSAKGRALLTKIGIETGLVFDEVKPIDRTRSKGGNERH